MDRRPDLLEKRLSRIFISTTVDNMIMGLEELSQFMYIIYQKVILHSGNLTRANKIAKNCCHFADHQ